VELHLFSALAQGPLDADTLTLQLGLHPRGARDFFDSLVALGFLERESGQYANTREADWFLDRAKPSYIGGGLEDPTGYEAWTKLTTALRTGEPQVPEAQGSDDRWAERYRTPDGVLRQTRGFTGTSRDAMQAIARQFPWQRYQTFIDIGTSAGDLPVQVALMHPHITGGGFDLPQVGAVFAEYVESFGLTSRLRFFPGSFFTDSLPSADVLALGSVLHNWKLETREMLLRKAYAALPAGGALIVKDRLIDDERRRDSGALLNSLHMFLHAPDAANYTGAECRAWMEAAGFKNVSTEPLAGSFSMMVGIK
jgi:O-methyltransferase domain/Dimerisation domain